MAMMAGKLYAALRAATVPESEAVAAISSEGRFQKIEDRFQRVETDLSVLKWMMETMIALQLGLIGTIVAFAINRGTFR